MNNYINLSDDAPKKEEIIMQIMAMVKRLGGEKPAVDDIYPILKLVWSDLSPLWVNMIIELKNK